MHSRISLGVGAGLAVTVVLAVAGCSGTAAKGNADKGIGSAGASAGSVNGSAVSLVADAMDKATSAGTVKVAGSISANGVAMTLSGDEQYSPSVEMSLKLQDAGQNMSEIFVGHQIYIADPAISAELGAKQWAEINLDEATGSLGALSSLVDSGRNEDPATQLSALLAAKSIGKVGTETVQGQQTTHYSGTLDAAQFLQGSASADQLSASQVASLKSLLQSGGVTTETVDVWVASSGLPVQVKVQAHTAAGETDTTMDLSDWGAPVQVSAPPASEITDITAKVNSALATSSAG
jgi:LppX_LprAFG lipoprotein